MEFENVNNLNIALEAKMKKESLLRSLVHLIKKILKRAKPVKCCVQTFDCDEEIAENLKNEELERLSIKIQQEADMKLFSYTTAYQSAQSQVF